jgi:hypothetical protein
MFPASESDRALLGAALGDGWDLRDGRHVDHAGLVVVRPAGPQTLQGLRARFPQARIVVVELPDDRQGGQAGPVRRALGAGANEYLLCSQPVITIAC